MGPEGYHREPGMMDGEPERDLSQDFEDFGPSDVVVIGGGGGDGDGANNPS
jgi:hypothetical protein